MKQALKYIIEYLNKRRTIDTSYSFSQSHREGFLIKPKIVQPKILDIKTVKQG
jgi:hypothetical protein